MVNSERGLFYNDDDESKVESLVKKTDTNKGGSNAYFG